MRTGRGGVPLQPGAEELIFAGPPFRNQPRSHLDSLVRPMGDRWTPRLRYGCVLEAARPVVFSPHPWDMGLAALGWLTSAVPQILFTTLIFFRLNSLESVWYIFKLIF